MRSNNRKFNQFREVSIEKDIIANAMGSCLIKFGNTQVICTATIDEAVPRFVKNTGTGWLTAEYSMLPASTVSRVQREATYGKQTGRTIEIQRLIGRSLRGAVNLEKLGPRQIIVDCDVISADGGTRTAAITGGYVAMHLAVRKAMDKKILKHNPLTNQIAAVSCGIVQGQAFIDLDYVEDSTAEVDANFVFNGAGKLLEVQATGEKAAFLPDELNSMLKLSTSAAAELFKLQNKILMDF
ncbi:MAG: ribonuclease PH [Rickettsiaceae bacterium]|nr:ribonuclease PH [Rickettsiaceae bacterium]